MVERETMAGTTVTYPKGCCPVLLLGSLAVIIAGPLLYYRAVKRTTRNASASQVEMPGQLDLHQLHLQTILEEQTHAGPDRPRTLLQDWNHGILLCEPQLPTNPKYNHRGEATSNNLP
ncbi:hypothetical protein B0T13DRAFT_122204 [Neurospora crassa]|nr:hypothetical protein B0T13DRAFT_122204 [Neurospora crassa]